MRILTNVAVVQIGDSAASRYGTKLLGHFGADVTVMGGPGDQGAEAGDEACRARREAMRVYLDAGKSERRGDLAELLATADVVVRDRDADVFRLTLEEEFAQLKARNSAAIYVVLSPLGADGPWGGRSGDDLADAGGRRSGRLHRPVRGEAVVGALRDHRAHPGAARGERGAVLPAAPGAGQADSAGRHRGQ